MASWKFKNSIKWALALAISFLLLYTAWDKLWHFPVLRLQLAKSPWGLLSGNPELFGWVVPLVEIGVALLFVNPKWMYGGFIAAVLLFLAFTVYVGIVWLSGRPVPCGCSLLIEKLSFKNHLWLNIGLAAISSWGICLAKPKTKIICTAAQREGQ